MVKACLWRVVLRNPWFCLNVRIDLDREISVFLWAEMFMVIARRIKGNWLFTLDETIFSVPASQSITHSGDCRAWPSLTLESILCDSNTGCPLRFHAKNASDAWRRRCIWADLDGWCPCLAISLIPHETIALLITMINSYDLVLQLARGFQDFGADRQDLMLQVLSISAISFLWSSRT